MSHNSTETLATIRETDTRYNKLVKPYLPFHTRSDRDLTKYNQNKYNLYAENWDITQTQKFHILPYKPNKFHHRNSSNRCCSLTKLTGSNSKIHSQACTALANFHVDYEIEGAGYNSDNENYLDRSKYNSAKQGVRKRKKRYSTTHSIDGQDNNKIEPFDLNNERYNKGKSNFRRKDTVLLTESKRQLHNFCNFPAKNIELLHTKRDLLSLKNFREVYALRALDKFLKQSTIVTNEKHYDIDIILDDLIKEMLIKEAQSKGKHAHHHGSIESDGINPFMDQEQEFESVVQNVRNDLFTTHEDLHENDAWLSKDGDIHLLSETLQACAVSVVG